jgi:hypothetical protein
MKPAPFKSDFAILDVKAGRAALATRVLRSGRAIRVRVDMLINASGSDDGTSTEFSCTVLSVKEFA